MNATRAATIRGRAWVGGVVSLGRVQTPTLALIVKREREIQAFVPEPYWLVHAHVRPALRGPLVRGRRDAAARRPSAPRRSSAKVSGKDGIVESVERKEQSERAPLLYDLTSLQRDANRRFGFSARRTLQAAQSLYEDKKAITYPRTSSRYLSGDLVPQLKPTAATLAADRASTPRRARYVIGLAAAAARPRRQRREGRRPPRDHPDRRRARRQPVLARRAADLRPRRPPLPRRLPPAGALRAHDGRHAWSRRSASARAARSRSRPAGAASTGCFRGRPGRADARTRKARTRAPSCRRSSRARRSRASTAEVRGQGDEAAAALHRGDAALRDGDRRQADRRRGAARGDEGVAGSARRRRAPRRSRR